MNKFSSENISKKKSTEHMDFIKHLVLNGCKSFSQRVDVEVDFTPELIIVSVSDYGTGISLENIKRLLLDSEESLPFEKSFMCDGDGYGFFNILITPFKQLILNTRYLDTSLTLNIYSDFHWTVSENNHDHDGTMVTLIIERAKIDFSREELQNFLSTYFGYSKTPVYLNGVHISPHLRNEINFLRKTYTDSNYHVSVTLKSNPETWIRFRCNSVFMKRVRSVYPYLEITIDKSRFFSDKPMDSAIEINTLKNELQHFIDDFIESFLHQMSGFSKNISSIESYKTSFFYLIKLTEAGYINDLKRQQLIPMSLGNTQKISVCLKKQLEFATVDNPSTHGINISFISPHMVDILRNVCKISEEYQLILPEKLNFYTLRMKEFNPVWNKYETWVNNNLKIKNIKNIQVISGEILPDDGNPYYYQTRDGRITGKPPDKYNKLIINMKNSFHIELLQAYCSYPEFSHFLLNTLYSD
ncbi:MAG: ATP-binding protein [Deltaproteobacteria bacterium]|nr:ATP-binding protein [Deltaproteobacteria bacterium]